MEPLPETLQALRELTRQGDEAIAETLWHITRAAEAVVPELVGVSLSLVHDQLTFTMTASTGPVAALDGMQYLAGGPCEEALRTGSPNVYRADETEVVDEHRWGLFARATAAAGVQSTLSLPILHQGAVVAGINLYASTPEAFDRRHEELATACGAWAGGAVTNADLDFSTRFEAAEAPDRLRDQGVVDAAIGVLMSRWDILRDAPERAGISDAGMARALLDLVGPPPPTADRTVGVCSVTSGVRGKQRSRKRPPEFRNDRSTTVLRLSGRAISLGEGWVIEIPSRRLRVRVRTLADTDARVTSALHLRSTAQWPPRALVHLTEFLTLDDCPAAKRRELSRTAGPPVAGSRAS